MIDIIRIGKDASTSLASGAVMDEVTEAFKNRRMPTVNGVVDRIDKIDVAKVAAAGAGIVGASLLTPFVCELLGVGEDLLPGGQSEGRFLGMSGTDVKCKIINMGIKFAAESAAAASIKHAPELVTSWAPKLMAHMHDTVHECVSDAVGSVVGNVTELAHSAAECILGGVAEDHLVDVGTETEAHSLLGAAIDKLSELFG